MRKEKEARLRLALYRCLVNRNPRIRRRYLEYRGQHPGKRGMLGGLALLFWWNGLTLLETAGRHILSAAWGGRGGEFSAVWTQIPDRLMLQESGLLNRPSWRQLADRLMPYDVISFDVFDTLLLRPLEEPSDLFYFVGMELGYPNFRRLRMEAEQKARSAHIRQGQSGEVTLEEIWEVLSRETGLDACRGLETEWRTEQRFCYANPYFLPVLEYLREQKKMLVITSDMYLGKERILRLLKDAGLGEFSAVFVSCTEGASKHQGDLFECVRQRFGWSRTYIHVGDHPYADRDMARSHHFDVLWYPSSCRTGRKFRPREMSPLIGSMYRGLVSQKLHGDDRRYDPLYEYGYVYGGLLAVGYCQFIRRFAISHRISRILFLSRDGDILRRVYRMLYPESDTRYVYWSRKAALKLTADCRRWEFFQRFLRDKADQGFSIEQCFASMEQEELLKELCRREGMDAKEELTGRRARICEEFLKNHWDRADAVYLPEREAAGRYAEGLLRGVRRAAVVDIGWAGNGGWALAHIAQKVSPPCRLFSLMAGVSGENSGDGDAVGGFLFQGEMASYLFSQSHNRELWKLHNPNRDHNLYLELLFTSPGPSLKGFSPDPSGRVLFHFGEKEPCPEKLLQIRRGILDFAGDWQRHFGWLKEGTGQIRGSDAYRPLEAVLKNSGYRRALERYFSWDTNLHVE